MKRIIVLTLLSAVLIFPFRTAAQAQDLTISLDLTKSVVALNAQIKMSITLRNTTAHDISVRKTGGGDHPEANYRISVTTDTGIAVPETASGKSARFAPSASRILQTLKPGESLTEVIDLEKFFEITAPGVYQVTVQRDVEKIETPSPSIAKTIKFVVR